SAHAGECTDNTRCPVERGRRDRRCREQVKCFATANALYERSGWRSDDGLRAYRNRYVQRRAGTTSRFRRDAIYHGSIRNTIGDGQRLVDEVTGTIGRPGNIRCALDGPAEHGTGHAVRIGYRNTCGFTAAYSLVVCKYVGNRLEPDRHVVSAYA